MLCLNAERTVRWEYTDREKNGYTSAEEATVLADGTIAVVVWDYPEKIAVKFFTPRGKRARKKLDLTKQCEPWQIYDITPSFIMKRDFVGDVLAKDYRYETTLYDWIRVGKFPAHIKLGRSSFWRESSLRTWFDALPGAVSTEGAAK